MKFINELLSFFNSKKFLILILLMTNCLIESNQRITLGKIMRNRAIRSETKERESLLKAAFGNKTFKYTMSLKARLTFGQKLKYFLVGFLSPVIVNILNKVLDNGAIKSIIIPTIDLCYEDTYLHYEKVVSETQKKLNCDPKLPHKIFPDEWKTEIQGSCSKKKSIEQLDDDQFSTTSVIFGYLKNIFTDNSKFIEDYKQFKADLKEIQKKIKEMNKEYLKKFQAEKDKYKDGTPEKEYLLKSIKKMSKTLFAKDICQIMEHCQDLTLWQRLKVLGNTAFFFVKCVPGALAKTLAKDLLYNVFRNALVKFGFDNFITVLISGILPAPLVALVFSLLIKGWNVLAKMISLSWTYIPEKSEYDNKERDLFLTIGSILGGLFSQLIGIVPITRTFKGSFNELFTNDQGDFIKNVFGRRKYRKLRELKRLLK